jgi:signal transduction histidine kinase
VRISDWIDRRLAGRQRLTLTVIGFVTVLAIVTGAIIVVLWLRGNALADQRRHLDDLARVLAQHASRTIEGVDIALTGLSERVTAISPEQRLDPNYLRQLLGDHVAGLPHAQAILFIDQSGVSRGDSEAAPPRPLDASDRAYFKHHQGSDGRSLFIDAPVLSRVSGLWTIVVSHAVRGTDGTWLGVIAAGLNPMVFSEFYSGLALAEAGLVLLVRADGALMVRFPPDDRAYADPARPADLLDSGWLASTRAVDRYPLSVTVAVPLSAALVGWEHQATIIAIAAVIALVVVILIGLVLLDQSQRLEATVRALAAARDAAVQACLREEEAGRAKSAFLANTSHELRTPLHAILGFSEIMRDGHLGMLEPRQRGYAAGIHDAGTHLLGLINDLLDMAKIEARQLQLRESLVDLADVIGDAVRLNERRAGQYGVSVIARTEPHSLTVRGDPQRLRQIAINLLSNAIKFTEAGGRVWIDASLDDRGRPTLVVRDTGIGMSAEDVEVALKPFRRIESSYAREREGTGLGLPIVKALVDMHGGTLTIESERQHGTTVTVALPAWRAVPQPASEKISQAS